MESNCSTCKDQDKKCTKEEILDCLGKSSCEHCGAINYKYPYGRTGSRHCVKCGAEWSVWK